MKNDYNWPKMKKSIYKVTEQGWQYCDHCKKDTWHTPKLGLIASNKRLCTMCNTSNKLYEIQTASQDKKED